MEFHECLLKDTSACHRGLHDEYFLIMGGGHSGTEGGSHPRYVFRGRRGLF